MRIGDAIRLSIEKYSAGGSFLPTGFEELDSRIGGFIPGDVVVIGARPGAGKTSLMTALSISAACHCSRHVVVFSREMSLDALVMMNYVPFCACMDVDAIRDKALPAVELKETVERSGLPFLPIEVIDSNGPEAGITAEQIEEYCDLQRPSIVFVDYLQILDSEGDSFSREQQVAKIMAKLSDIAKRFSVPIVVLAQLKRPEKSNKKDKDDHDKEPEITDLRESGAIEHYAQTILLIWPRNEFELRNDGTRDRKVSLVIGKQRNGESQNEHGSIKINLTFRGKFKMFLEHAEQMLALQAKMQSFDPDNF